MARNDVRVARAMRAKDARAMRASARARVMRDDMKEEKDAR